MTRAVLEGVAFGLKDCLGLVQRAGLGGTRQVRVSGGGARSALWRQILSDVLEVDLITVTTTEGAAYGAALLAGVGSGVYANVPTACAIAVQEAGRTEPGRAARVYPDYYACYRALYPALTGCFEALARAANSTFEGQVVEPI
jgi:xylulokinase